MLNHVKSSTLINQIFYSGSFMLFSIQCTLMNKCTCIFTRFALPKILFFLFCSYRLRVESMLLKAEFEANKSFIEHSQGDMLEAGEKLMSCQKLQDLFYMVLMAGNFLNSVRHLFRIIAKSQNL